MAKKEGDFLYVGIWDDEMTRYYRGEQYPIQTLQERVLMVLSCKHVDDVVIGAPFEITQDLVNSLNIHKVVTISNTQEDAVLPRFSFSQQFDIPKQKEMLTTLEVKDQFYDITAEKIAARVKANKELYELKV